MSESGFQVVARAWVLGLMVWDLRFRAWGLGFGVLGFGFRVWASKTRAIVGGRACDEARKKPGRWKVMHLRVFVPGQMNERHVRDIFPIATTIMVELAIIGPLLWASCLPPN